MDKDGTPQRRVAFNMSPLMAAEAARILALTDLGSCPELFRRALTLLRIHVDAARKNQQICMLDPAKPRERALIVLPFTVDTPPAGG